MSSLRPYSVKLNGEPGERLRGESAAAVALDQVNAQLSRGRHRGRHVIFRVPDEPGRAAAYIYQRSERDPETTITVREVPA